MRIETAVFLMVLGGAGCMSNAAADAECVKGYHDMTVEESATMTAVLESARAAVPEPPDGWVNTLNDDSVSPPQMVCLDFSPWTYAYGRNYTRIEGHEAREQAIADAGAVAKASMAERQPRLDALQAESTNLSQQFAEAATNGDNARVQEIQAEMERLSAEFYRVMNEGDTFGAYESATASQYSDLEMSVSVRFNPTTASPMEAAEVFEVRDASFAYLWTSGEGGNDGNALVLFGNWRTASSGYGLEAVPTPGAGPEQPQAISVMIMAHRDRLHTLIDATDFSALAALLKR